MDSLAEANFLLDSAQLMFYSLVSKEVRSVTRVAVYKWINAFKFPCNGCRSPGVDEVIGASSHRR